MNKKSLTEADIRTKFITPAIVGEKGTKWNVMTQLLEERYFTKGRVIVRGKMVTRGEAKKADYILFYKPNIPTAVVEAKDNNHSVGAGMQQALEYAEILDVPFAYSSNGDAFLEHDRTGASSTVEREIPLGQFPTPDELWARYSAAKGYTAAQEAVTTQDYYDDGSSKSPRYYQLVAINRTVDAIAHGENRILPVMATGTGKTYTAFQIIWRLWKSGVKTRIKEALLADCNLHTIIRLPNGVFNPYTGIRTNLLFFTKGQPTTEVWYYEHPYPSGAKSYNKGKPIRIEEFEPEKAWWDHRGENEQAWSVPIDQIKAGNYNLDLKNPHQTDTGPGDVDHLLPDYEKLLAQIAETRAALKTELHRALTATAGTEA